MEILRNIAPFITLIIVVVPFIIAIAAIYVKAPPDTAVIITGLWKKPRILIGQAGIRIPLLETTDKLPLKQIPITICAKCLTADLIKIKLKVVINVQIPEDESILRLAAKNFLNLNSKEIANSLRNILWGTINTTIRNQTASNICKGWASLEQCLHHSAEASIGNLGIKVLSCHILKISTSNDVIKNMATVSASQIKKEAFIAEKDFQLAKAKAKVEVSLINLNLLTVTNDITKSAGEILEFMKQISSCTTGISSSEDNESEASENKQTDNTTVAKDNSQQKIQASINHIGEMIRKDFTED